jgi:hypothetical protein
VNNSFAYSSVESDFGLFCHHIRPLITFSSELYPSVPTLAIIQVSSGLFSCHPSRQGIFDSYVPLFGTASMGVRVSSPLSVPDFFIIKGLPPQSHWEAKAIPLSPISNAMARQSQLLSYTLH